MTTAAGALVTRPHGMRRPGAAERIDLGVPGASPDVAAFQWP
ncbi:MAG TPA: hypothetical protein VIU11_00685 [Nakamurella sp.]